MKVSSGISFYLFFLIFCFVFLFLFFWVFLEKKKLTPKYDFAMKIVKMKERALTKVSFCPRKKGN